jgi:hypothetical protein
MLVVRRNMPMKNRSLALSFESVFQRLLFFEAVALDTPEISSMFELIATNLLAGTPGREHQYFDGAVGLSSKVRTSRKIEFQGQMWVGGEGTQWTEPLKATVTEKNEKGSRKRRVWISISVGADRATAELFSAFGVSPQAESGRREDCPPGSHTT